MISVIQRVTHAHVKINDEIVGAIDHGIMALIGIEKTDTEKEAEKLVHKMIHYRIFSDEQGKMNQSVLDVKGGLLLVSQFTLVAETAKGTRPGFSKGMPPLEGKRLFEYLVDHAKKQDLFVATGQFGADMQISLCNDGPVTFILTT